jgi:hypothetical protein
MIDKNVESRYGWKQVFNHPVFCNNDIKKLEESLKESLKEALK